MILDSKSGLRGVLVNATSGKRIPFAFWADMETGEYRAWKTDESGQVQLRDAAGNKIEVRGFARLQFIPAKPLHRMRPGGTPLRDIKAELLATGKAKPIVMLPGQECEYPGCHKLAEYRVADEQVVEPEVGQDGKTYERAVVTRGHNYCSLVAHWRPPVQTSERGVESEVTNVLRPE